MDAILQDLQSLHIQGVFCLGMRGTNDQVYNLYLVGRKEHKAFNIAVQAKACILVHRYSQVEGIDFHDTYSLELQ